MGSTSKPKRVLPSEPVSETFFHGTSLDLLEDIKRDGLKCACQPGMGCTAEFRDVADAVGVVCLTNDPKRARFYALASTVAIRHHNFKETLIVEVDLEPLSASYSSGRLPLEHRIPSEGEYPTEFDFRGSIPPQLLKFYKWDNDVRDYVLIE